MADFEEALNSLLSDPDAMGQIMALAGKLGMGGDTPSPDPSEPPSPQETPTAQAGSPPLLGPEQLSQVGKLLELVQTSRQADQEADALIAAPAAHSCGLTGRKSWTGPASCRPVPAARQAYRLWKEGELHL